MMTGRWVVPVVPVVAIDDVKVRCYACYDYYAEEESFATMRGLVSYDEFSF